MRHLQRIIIACLFWLLIQPASATSFALEAGLHYGGDDLASAVFTSGSSSTIRAGQLYSFSLGAGFDITRNLVSRVTFGIKGDDITASNGDISFMRYPIDVLVLYKAGQWQIGGGLTYHMSPKLKGSGAASFVNATFDDATGALGEVDYFFQPNAYFGFRYTSINYTVKSTSISVDGNSIGIVIGALL